MDERLVEAVNAFLQVSSDEELSQVLQKYPELLTQKAEINAIFEFGIAQAREENEVERAEFFEQRYQMLKTVQQNNNPFASFIRRAKTDVQHYLRTGDRNSLDTAIDAWEKILQHPEFEKMEADFKLRVLNNSAGTYLRRYWARGQLTDLNTALKAWETAIAQTPPDSPDLPSRLNNLGTGLRNRYLRLGELADLQAGIAAYQQAIEEISKTPPDSPDLPGYLNNLGTGLTDRYSRLGALADLQAGITAYQQAIEKTSPDSPDLPGYLNNLGIGLTDRYLCLGELADLQAGIAAYQQAIDKTPYDSPDLPSMLNNLGTGLADRYSCLGELADLQAGIAAYQKAVKLGEKHSIADWLTSACNWLNWAFERNRWAEIEEAYPALQKASKQLVEKQLLREHKETVLKDTQGIAVKVAYARIQTGQLAGAVDALEQGVARLLSSTLARSDADLTPLQQDSPKLHKRYQLQLQAVNKAQHFYQNAPKDRLEKARIKWQNEEKRFNKLLKKIRKLSGHKNFLRIATDISTVRQVSQQQPLIYIFATEKGGYALNIFRGEIQAVALPELTTATVSKKIDSYFQVYIESDKPFFDPAYGYEDNDEAFNDWRHTIDSIKKWLYQAIMQPILQNIPPHPHIILIPIGALNLLPLHAAYLTADNQRHYMLDDYTISYAPNALSLQMARNRAEINPEKCLLIGNPEEDLPASDTEIIAIQKCFNISKKIERKQATKETVTSELNNDYSVLHFACHGEADRENPLEKTGLFMVNHEMLTVQDFLNANLNARLVGLSACETGIIGEKLPDEVVGLPTSLLQAGVAGVVASLWVADDFSTMLLMAQFYQRWFNEYPDNPAEALRFAQIWVRDSTQSKIEEFLKTFLSESEVNEILEDKEINFSHPYFWAAFSYTGV